MKPFGEKQLICVGEFLQLPSVPGPLHDGRPMFGSSLWRKVLPHRYELISIMRQGRSERSFLHCLKRIRLGFCSKVSEVSIKGLSRNLEDSLRREATHIFPQSEGVICQLKRSAQVAR